MQKHVRSRQRFVDFYLYFTKCLSGQHIEFSLAQDSSPMGTAVSCGNGVSTPLRSIFCSMVINAVDTKHHYNVPTRLLEFNTVFCE